MGAFAVTFNVPISLVFGLGECCAALQSTNRKADARWDKLMPQSELESLCPHATFVPTAPVREHFLDKRTGQSCVSRLARGKSHLLVVTHREAISKLCKSKAKVTAQPTPYAGIGKFGIASIGSDQERWTFLGMMNTSIHKGSHTLDIAISHRAKSAERDCNCRSFVLSLGMIAVAGNVKHMHGSTLLRCGPFEDSQFLGVSVENGTPVTVQDVAGSKWEWVRIDTRHGGSGWLKTRNIHLQLHEQVGTLPTKNCFVMTAGRQVLVGNTRSHHATPLRRCPLKATVTGHNVVDGSVAQVLESTVDADWARVVCGQAEGWISTRHLHVQVT